MDLDPVRAALFCALMVLASAAPVLAQGDPQAALRRAEELIQSGRLNAAEELLRSAGPGAGPRADYLLGFVLLQRYRFAEAEEALRRAVDAEPGNHAWLHALAKTLLEQGKNRAAIEVLDHALALASEPEYRFAKAMCALNVGELDLAETELRQSLADDPGHAEAYYRLGAIAVERGDYAAALEPLRRALELAPEHLEARYLLGLAAARVDDRETAAAAFEAVLAKIPGHVGALYNLGHTLLRLGRRDEGAARLEAFRGMSELRDRIDFLERTVAKNPQSLAHRLELAELLLEAGRGEDARDALLAARQLAPAEPRVYRLLATALRRLGREEEAAQAEAFAARLGEGR